MRPEQENLDLRKAVSSIDLKQWVSWQKFQSAEELECQKQKEEKWKEKMACLNRAQIKCCRQGSS